MTEELMTFIEPFTKKRITYTSSSVFAMYLRYENKPARLHKLFTSDRIADAVKEYSDLDLTKKYRKYLYVQPDHLHLSRAEGTLVLYMVCQADHNGDFKSTRKLSTYRKKASVNLIQTPETLADKLSNTVYKELPKVEERWSKQLLVHSLLAYFYTLDKESKEALARRSYMALVAEKIASSI